MLFSREKKLSLTSSSSVKCCSFSPFIVIVFELNEISGNSFFEENIYSFEITGSRQKDTRPADEIIKDGGGQWSARQQSYVPLRWFFPVRYLDSQDTTHKFW